MSRSITVSLIALLVSACALPVEEAATGDGPALTAEGKGGKVGKKVAVMGAPLAADGAACKVDADCMPTTKECGAERCIEGACAVVALPKGAACQGGVGSCDGSGECLKVEAQCKGWDGSVLRPCDAASECDDGSPCTADTCEAGWCRHTPLADGKSCGSILSCNQGLCCVPQ